MDLKGHRVTVMGMARSGQAAALLARDLGAAVLCTDQRAGVTHPPGTEGVMGEHREADFTEADLVGAFVMNEFGTVLERLLLLAEPVVRRLDEIAGTRDIDIPVLAEWVARVVLTMVVAPPAVPPQEFLREVLRPLLVATGSER